MVKFCPLASGSNGNSLFIGAENTGILIDAGLSGKELTNRLAQIGVSADSIDALFITHEHADHIKGAGVFSRKFDTPIYATPKTWEAMEGLIGKVAPKNIRYVYGGENCYINDICVLPFEIPHDAAEPVAYSVFAEKYKMTTATDLGHITPVIEDNLQENDVLLLEANHDAQMLRNGSYPASLKRRILGDNGHISNETAGKVLADIFDKRLKYVFLGHLSDENNEPHLAYETVESILKERNIAVGKELKMDMATRYSVSCPVELR